MWWLLSRLCLVCVLATIDLKRVSPTAVRVVQAGMTMLAAVAHRTYEAVTPGPASDVRVTGMIIVPEQDVWWHVLRALGSMELSRVATVRIIAPERLVLQNPLVTLMCSFVCIHHNMENARLDNAIVVSCVETSALRGESPSSEGVMR